MISFLINDYESLLFIVTAWAILEIQFSFFLNSLMAKIHLLRWISGMFEVRTLIIIFQVV